MDISTPLGSLKYENHKHQTRAIDEKVPIIYGKLYFLTPINLYYFCNDLLKLKSFQFNVSNF
jgi:hypothetical protein